MSEKKTVLVIDDEEDLLVIVKTALKQEGYEVVTANNGPAALKVCKSLKPDLITVDLMMPVMDGFQTIEAIRNIPEYEKIPVIMITGVMDKNKIAHALESDINYYLLKPFEFHDFISKVQIAINSK